MPPGFDFIAFDGPMLGVPDDYLSLPMKTKAIANFAFANRYDGLFKVDDDVFVRTEKLRVPNVHYGGHVLPQGANIHDEKESYCAGGFYWLDSWAMRIVAHAPFIARTNAEDQWVGWTLRACGIKSFALPDVAMQPCLCGRCTPATVPLTWMAYMLWKDYTRQEFEDLERCYG